MFKESGDGRFRSAARGDVWLIYITDRSFGDSPMHDVEAGSCTTQDIRMHTIGAGAIGSKNVGFQVLVLTLSMTHI